MQGEGDLIKEMIRESGLDPAEYTGVAEALAAMRALVPEQAPVPSAELAALMSGGVVAPLAPRGEGRRRVVAVGALTAALMVGGGVAAATNTLPDPLQRFVHDLSEKVLPFEFPDAGSKNDGPHQLPEPAHNDIDQGEHVGTGDGGGKTGNLGREDDAPVPDDPGKPDNPGRPDGAPGERPDTTDVTPPVPPKPTPSAGGPDETSQAPAPEQQSGQGGTDRGGSAGAKGKSKTKG